MPRLVHLVPACILVSCVSGSAPPAPKGTGQNRICSAGEDYVAQRDDCFATPTAEEVGVPPQVFRDGAKWKAWQGLCLVEGTDRLLAGNGVCELQEGMRFRSDCEQTCGDGVLTKGEETWCMHDLLVKNRGCDADAANCEVPADCGNRQCEYDDEHKEDACTCPEDCSIPEQYGTIRNEDGSCTVPANGPGSNGECFCGDGFCKQYENVHSCPEDCKEDGTTSSTGDTSTTSGDACDDDPACGPDETPETCPEQCSECGDGILSGTEQCDNGQANQTHWPDTPPDDACSELCTTALEWCGDGVQNADEQCDNADNTDPPYAPTLPPNACAPGCKLPGYCGDGENTAEEACDDGMQTATCETTCLMRTCGDGIKNEPAGEACDDGNNADGDGCSADCLAIERKVFVTSTFFPGDLNWENPDNTEDLKGLPLADFRCQQRATAANLPGNFKAWLSTAKESPSMRFDTNFEGLYRLTSPGAPIVAVGWEGLVKPGGLEIPINAHEDGKPVTVFPETVWTNTSSSGTKASDSDCSTWTVKDGSKTTIGSSNLEDGTWTNLDTTQCFNTARLYCFEDL